MGALRRANGELVARVGSGEEDGERLKRLLKEAGGEVSEGKRMLSERDAEGFELRGRVERLGKELLE